VDHPTAVQALATATPWDSTLDACTRGVVQDTWESDTVSAGVFRVLAQGPMEGVPGQATCEQSRELSSSSCDRASLTLILLTSRIWLAPNNTSKWQMAFNSAFEGLT